MMFKLPKMISCISNSYGELTEGQGIGPAEWPHFDLIFIHDGEISLRLLKKDQIELCAGQAVLIYPQTSFSGYAAISGTRISVHHFNAPGDVSSDKKSGYELFLQVSSSAVDQDIERIMRLGDYNSSEIINEMRCALMSLIISQLYMAQHKDFSVKQTESEFQYLIEWLKNNIGTHITLADMAARMCLSTSHFRVRFRGGMGVAPGEYFMNMRMNEATRLLRESMMPIKEISTFVGYKELPHFYRAFKSYYAITPHVYRKKYSLPELTCGR